MINNSHSFLLLSYLFLHDIIKKNGNKGIVEKYGNILLSGGMSIFNLLYGIMVGLFFINLGKIINFSKEICYDIYCDYLKKLMLFLNEEDVNRLNFDGNDDCGRYVYKFDYGKKMKRIRRIGK